MGEKILELSGIYKTFEGQDVLNGIDLYIKRNEFLTLLGLAPPPAVTTP